MRLFLVDAFTDKLFSGNPTAVLLLEGWLAEGVMQMIAGQTGLAITVFACRIAEACWALRWFTPMSEVDFCGHATIAAAHVIYTARNSVAPFAFRCKSTSLPTRQTENGYQVDFPTQPPEPLMSLPAVLVAQFGNRASGWFHSTDTIYVDLGTSAAVRSFCPDMPALHSLGATRLCLTGQAAPGEAGDYVSRCFAPGLGIPENAATGAIHSTLAPYWAAKLGKDQLTALHATARGGSVHCALSADRVHLTGQAVTFMEGRITLPDLA